MSRVARLCPASEVPEAPLARFPMCRPPFPGLCFIKKAVGPLCVCRAGLESPSRSPRTSDKEAVRTVRRGNTVLLFCFTVLLICPQPANQVSSRNTAGHSPSLGACAERGGGKCQQEFCQSSALFTGSGGFCFMSFHGGHWTGHSKGWKPLWDLYWRIFPDKVLNLCIQPYIFSGSETN